MNCYMEALASAGMTGDEVKGWQPRGVWLGKGALTFERGDELPETIVAAGASTATPLVVTVLA